MAVSKGTRRKIYKGVLKFENFEEECKKKFLVDNVHTTVIITIIIIIIIKQ